MAVGIDDLNVVSASRVVKAAELAAARGTSAAVAKLGLVERAVPSPFEDPITMAVNAARPLLDAPEQIGLLLVATESACDDAQPISAYIQHWLGLPRTCRHAEVKHACYGGTLALRMAADWVAAGVDRTALVITTDIARKLFGDSAEPAEGAGAVAMTVTRDPRVLAFGALQCVAAEEIFDVRRPTRTAEVIDARKSLAAYLDLLEECWDGVCDVEGADAVTAFDFVLYHTPLESLVAQAHRLVVQSDASSDFAALVAPSMRFGARIGNTYSGSLYVALASLCVERAIDAPCRIGLFSYGSGSCAEFYDGWLQPTARAQVLRHGIEAMLDGREVVDVAAYEAAVVAVETSLSEARFVPDGVAPSGLVLAAVTDHHRTYRWN